MSKKDEDLNDIGKRTAKVIPFKAEDLNATFELPDDIAEKALEKMNAKHIFVNSIGGKPMVACQVYSEVFGRTITEFRSPDAIITQYSNENLESTKKSSEPMSLGKWWITNSERKSVDTAVFEPNEPSGIVKKTLKDGQELEVLNLWEGFAVQEQKGCWHFSKRHIWQILCNKDETKFRYFMRWLAWCIQNPGERAEVAVVFKGKKGAGKGFLFTILSELFGRHGMSISNSEHLTGKHNAHLMLTSFLFGDEAYYPGDKGIEGVLKQLITEPNLTVEPKFQNTRLAKNCLHIGMATNMDWVIPASGDERRYFINAVDDTYAKGQISDAVRNKYFSRIWNEMREGGKAAMLYDLRRVDLGKWHPRDDVPDTTELRRQALMSIGRKENHILMLLENGHLPGYINPYKEYIVESNELIDYMNKLDPGNRVTMRLKAEVLKKLGALNVKRDNRRLWLFKPLGEMRLAWNKNISWYEWDDYEDWNVEVRNLASTPRGY